MVDRINRLFRWFRERTVSRDLIISVLLVAGAVVLVMGILNYYAIRQVAKHELESRLERNSNALTRRLAKAMADGDYDMAVSMLRDAKSDLPNSEIRLEDAKGRIVFLHDNPLNSPFTTAQSTEKNIEYDKQYHGKLRLKIYSERVSLVMRNTLTLTFSSIAMLLLTLMITLKIIINRFLNRSLQQVQTGIRIFGDGNYDHRIAPSMYRDIQPIVAEINLMAQYISNRTLQLQREISERRRTEAELMENRRKLLTLFQNLPGMAFRASHDPIMMIDFVSEGSKKLTGYDPDQLVGEGGIGYDSLILQEDVPRVNLARKQGVEQGPYEVEYGITTVDGKERYVWEQGIGITNVFGEILAVEGFIMDITSRKHVEQELRTLNEELEMRVEARTADLELSNRALTESLKLIKETQVRLVENEKLVALGGMVAGMAHEINNPLGISVTAASFLETKLQETLDTFSDELNPQTVEVLLGLQESTRIIRTNIKRASELVNGFKKVAIDQSIEEKRIFNVRDYLEELMLSLRPELKKSVVNVHIDCPDNLQIDSYPGAFSQIITNLVINAVRHAFKTRGRGRIDLGVKQAARHLMIVFNDDGCGIPEDVLPKIFDPFFTTARGQGGSGLGLHIVFSIVTNTLKGDIHCDSRVDSGTRFIIRIPYSELGTTLMIGSPASEKPRN